MKKSIITLTMIMSSITFFSCGKETPSKNDDNFKQLNVSVLIDLSDRINPNLHPLQVNKDQIILNALLKNFKKFMENKGVVNSEDKINFFFHPQPQEMEILTISDMLNMDMSKIKIQERKFAFRNYEEKYDSVINRLYDIMISQAKYTGSDIFSFFKDQVYDNCIIDNPNYRNVLFILTDGYMYWNRNKQNIKNRFSYILSTAPQMEKFRQSDNWEKIFASEDYGFINIGRKLNNLEVIVLEINPNLNQIKDFDIIKKYWSKWFDEMEVKNNTLLKTDMPNNTVSQIEKVILKEELSYTNSK